MSIKNTAKHYGLVFKILHWLIALLIICQIFLGFFLHHLENKASIQRGFFVHKSMGISLLFLAIIFILWRFINRKPSWPNTMPLWERFAARCVHVLLYLSILIMPLSGWLMSAAAGYPPSFWGLFTLHSPFAVNAKLASFFGDVHVTCAWIISALIIIHILAALKHAFIDRDDVLQKMLHRR
jgi:cytochrome b561